jgi:hypothetical protein
MGKQILIPLTDSTYTKEYWINDKSGL